MAERKFKIQKLEERIAPAIATNTFVLKQPGPTNTIVTTAENPGGNNPPGHQSTVVVANRFAK